MKSREANPYTLGNQKIEKLPAIRIVNHTSGALRVPALNDQVVEPGEVVTVPGWLGWGLCRGGNFVPADDASADVFRRAELADRQRIAGWTTMVLRDEHFVARCPMSHQWLAKFTRQRKLLELSHDCKVPGEPSWFATPFARGAGDGMFVDGDSLRCNPCSKRCGTFVKHDFRFPSSSP